MPPVPPAPEETPPNAERTKEKEHRVWIIVLASVDAECVRVVFALVPVKVEGGGKKRIQVRVDCWSIRVANSWVLRIVQMDFEMLRRFSSTTTVR